MTGMTLRKLWWMAAGRWEWGTAQMGNLLATAFDKTHTPVNPFKPPPERTEAQRKAESDIGWAALREAAKGWSDAWKRKHGVTEKKPDGDGGS